MDDLFYSNDALNIINQFYNCDKIIYVEGDDDVVFWEVVFGKFNISNVKAIPTGGKEELKKFEKILESTQVEYIIAKDADYTHLTNDIECRENIIITPGHSIENSLICPETIKKCIQTNGRISVKDINTNEIKQWITHFCESFRELILLDIGNEISGLGLSVLGANFSQFVSEDEPEVPCATKIDKKKSDVIRTRAKTGFKYEEVLVNKNIPWQDCIRGHFIFSGVLAFVNRKIIEKGNKKNISNQNLFSSLISNFENIFTKEHRHYELYKAQIERAFVKTLQ